MHAEQLFNLGCAPYFPSIACRGAQHAFGQQAQATPVISGGGDGISAKQLEKELQNQEKKLKKSFDDDMKKREK